MEIKQRERMAYYAMSFLLVPYYWGGDNFAFQDCSGFCIEVAKSVGLLPHQYDNTANGLWERWRVGERAINEDPKQGDFVFWFKDDWAYHIEMALNESQVIGASGGGRPEFDLFKEAMQDPILAENYTDFSREEFYASAVDDYSIKQLKHFLIQDEAIKRDAFVKIRPIIYRGLKFKVCNPFQYGGPS